MCHLQNKEDKPKEVSVLHMPVIYVFTDKEEKYKYAMLYVGNNQILIPTPELSTVSILMLFIKSHHVFQVGYTCCNEVLALLIEMTLGDFTKSETDCTPNVILEKFIYSLGYIHLLAKNVIFFLLTFLISNFRDYRNLKYGNLKDAAIVKRRPLLDCTIRSPECPKKGQAARRGRKRKINANGKSQTAVKKSSKKIAC